MKKGRVGSKLESRHLFKLLKSHSLSASENTHGMTL